MAGYDASIRVNTKVDNSDLGKLQKEFDSINTKLDKLYEKGEKLEALGVDKQGKQWQSLRYDVAQYEAALFDVEERIKEVNGLKTEDSANGFSKLENSSKKCFRAIQSGTNKSNGLLKTMASRLKGITLSLFVFNWITKGFNAMVSAMKEGFRNLAQYSADYNKSMSDLKSQTAQLKNGLAAAFEPIANMVIPYITQLVSWLNMATDAMSKFLAIIQGKNSYTRARKQMIDYAKSIDTASKSAKSALAPFDDLNVLSKSESASGNASGELTGSDAFETVQITDEDIKMFDLVKDKLQEILGILLLVGAAMAVFGVGGPLASFVGVLLTIIGLLQFIISYMDAWANGISFDNLHGMLLGLLSVITGIYLLFGPMAAGLALIVGGIALVVLAIKDMIDNGVNAQNCITLAIGLVASLVGIFIVFGGTAAVVVGAIVSVISIFAALISAAGNGEEAIATLKSMFKNFADFFKKIFAGDIEGALDSIKAAGKDFVNIVIIAVESLINCIIKGLNWLIDKINSISFDVPDWVPGIGGKTMGFNIPNINEVDLPRLKDGMVIQGGAPFAAILGDQRFGQTNIETPLPTMVEAFKQALSDMGGLNSGYNGPLYLQIDGKTFAKLELPYIQDEQQRIGTSFSLS